MAIADKRTNELTGGVGKDTNSARAGLLPISLERAPLGTFDGIAVYLRGRENSAKAAPPKFTLYCSDQVKLTPQHRQTLCGRGVKFVYIPIADQERFRRQTEEMLLETMDDPSLSVSVKSEILYETSVALINELLSDPASIGGNPRLQKVSKSVAMLVLNEPKSFAHLFATSHHDFYTATHMVNVATWMVPLAHAMGFQKSEELGRICLAGLLHDIGKTKISADTLNKKGRLPDQEWKQIRMHPEMGCEYLKRNDVTDPLIHTVVRQHHERLNGKGYPDGLAGDAIHPVSRICAVVDSFDAMTALRPFKERTMSVSQALKVLTDETPQHYDGEVVAAWVDLLKGSEADGILSESLRAADGVTNRHFTRFRVDCPLRVQLLQPKTQDWLEQTAITAKAHNISRTGIGLLSDKPLRVNEIIRLNLLGRGTLRRTYEGMTLRCRAFKDGWHEVGIRLCSLVSEDDITTLAAA